MKYRKAEINDLNSIANLVTDLLGTCSIDNDSNLQVNRDDIFSYNVEEISKNINNYYICEIDKRIVGACGISDIKYDNIYNLDLNEYREILYLVVDNNYQRKGIGTELLKLCCEGINDVILYEAWGDKEEVNSKYILERCAFELFKNLGDTYYKINGYCEYCLNRNKDCNSCKAELWIKNNDL
ncbi:MAG: GNAT family N-acetyltransferase [Bacilli bacterium]